MALTMTQRERDRKAEKFDRMAKVLQSDLHRVPLPPDVKERLTIARSALLVAAAYLRSMN